MAEIGRSLPQATNIELGRCDNDIYDAGQCWYTLDLPRRPALAVTLQCHEGKERCSVISDLPL